MAWLIRLKPPGIVKNTQGNLIYNTLPFKDLQSLMSCSICFINTSFHSVIQIFWLKLKSKPFTLIYVFYLLEAVHLKKLLCFHNLSEWFCLEILLYFMLSSSICVFNSWINIYLTFSFYLGRLLCMLSKNFWKPFH